MADFNYEMALAVLPLFLTAGLGAPAYAVGLVEGVADGSSALVKVLSGWYSDRIGWRKKLAVAGYAATAGGFGSIGLITAWPLVIVARAFAWVGRGARQPIRSSMLAGSVERADLGKAFGFHEAMDTAGALAGPATAFALLAAGLGFRSVFWVSLIPGALCVLLFAVLTRDPRPKPSAGRPAWTPLPGRFWRLLVAVGVFGVGNFAPAFFTLRAAEMLRPELSPAAATSGAVLFYLAHQAVATVASFPGGWLADRVGKAPVLAFAYAVFGVACLLAMVLHGPLGVALLAIPVGIQSPLVNATEQSLTSSLIEDALQGTAFGVLAGVNAVGDLLSSVTVGALWTLRGSAWALAFGAVLCLAGAALLSANIPRLGARE